MTDENRIIVIGSGPAGAAAAAALVAGGVAVTMLESGASQPRGLIVRLGARTMYRRFPGDQEQHTFRATDPDTVWHHELTLGGLSNHWTGAIPRFTPQDFEEGARLDERFRWPVSYEELVPYYERAEQFMGVIGGRRSTATHVSTDQGVIRRLPSAWQKLADLADQEGQTLTSLPLARGKSWSISASATEFNSYHLIQKLEQSPLFTLHGAAHALTIDCDGDLATSVTYLDRTTGQRETLGAAGVVLAAGTIASTKLLLHSVSSRFPAGLGNTNDLVGRYLHDHGHAWTSFLLEKSIRRLEQPAVLSRERYASSPPLEAAQSTLTTTTGLWDKIKSLAGLSSSHVYASIFSSSVPRPEQRIRLQTDELDCFGQPLVQFEYTPEESLERTVQRASDGLLDLFQKGGHAARQIDSAIGPPGSSAHWSGSVRMHDQPEFGVLDGRNRMHQVPNVAVVDASCFTTGVEKNPTLTIAALALRAAEHLMADLKQGTPAAVTA